MEEGGRVLGRNLLPSSPTWYLHGVTASTIYLRRAFGTLFLLAKLVNSMTARSLIVRGAGETVVNGVFSPRSPKSVPSGFARTCDEMGWSPDKMWTKLADNSRVWYEHDNESYIYWNKSDGRWWIDIPSGAGAYIVGSSADDPPRKGWQALPGMKVPTPSVSIITNSED